MNFQANNYYYFGSLNERDGEKERKITKLPNDESETGNERKWTKESAKRKRNKAYNLKRTENQTRTERLRDRDPFV